MSWVALKNFAYKTEAGLTRVTKGKTLSRLPEAVVESALRKGFIEEKASKPKEGDA